MKVCIQRLDITSKIALMIKEVSGDYMFEVLPDYQATLHVEALIVYINLFNKKTKPEGITGSQADRLSGNKCIVIAGVGIRYFSK